MPLAPGTDPKRGRGGAADADERTHVTLSSKILATALRFAVRYMKNSVTTFDSYRGFCLPIRDNIEGSRRRSSRQADGRKLPSGRRPAWAQQ